MELEETLDRCILLFSHMSDKDLFAQLYREALSKRLLNKKSKSNDSERTMINNLRINCGGTYTSKLEGMLSDFSLAENMNKDFEPAFISWRNQQNNPTLVILSHSCLFLLFILSYLHIHIFDCFPSSRLPFFLFLFFNFSVFSFFHFSIISNFLFLIFRFFPRMEFPSGSRFYHQVTGLLKNKKK